VGILTRFVATVKLICFSVAQDCIDESFIKEAVLARLGDDNLDVVLSAVSAFKVSSSRTCAFCFINTCFSHDSLL
jgi:hypothetical protein